MKLALCCFFLLWSTLVYGQVAGNIGLNADGKDYYLGWLFPSLNSQDLSSLGNQSPLPFFGVFALVSSYSDNQFSLSYFDDKTGQETNTQTFSVAKRRSLIVPIDRLKMRMTEQGEIAEWKSAHIVAKKPITVQFFSTGPCSGGTYVAMPVNLLGKEYVVESYNDNPGEGGFVSHEHAAGYFMVIAPFDGTTVQIIPNSTTAKGKVGASTGLGSTGTPKSFAISLQRGQCYMVKSTGEQTGFDISGSTITSNKPISVIAGHENANIAASSVGSFDHLDARDYMVEQMIPVEYWDSTGYVSLPFVDATNAQGGAGDEYRVFYGKSEDAPVGYPSDALIKMKPDTGLKAAAFPLQVASRKNVTEPVSFASTNGSKFHVVQYDQRMQGNLPSPAPSQMSIIPMSSWCTSYLWYAPANVTPQEVYQSNYINVICDKSDYNNGTLQWAQDGGALVPLKSAGTLYGIKTIPGYPNLIGVTIKLSVPRAYYITSTTKTRFVVYFYGYRAIDAARSLGGNKESNFYFSYASPVGLVTKNADTSYFTILADTQCSKWNICASVMGKAKPKFRTIYLLADPSEDLVDKPNSTVGYESYNVSFDSKDDPDRKGQIDLQGTDSSRCLTVNIRNPLDSAYAAVLFVDDKGNYHLAEFTYKAPALSDTIISSGFDISKSPWYLLGRDWGHDPTISKYHKDSILYPITKVGGSYCATTYYYSKGDSSIGSVPTVVTGITLGGADGSFTMTANRSLPVILRPQSKSHPADTLAVTICFTAKDTLLHLDTVTLQTECFAAPLTIFGQGGTPLITATDYDYGQVVVGSSNCTGNSMYGPSRITIRNVGTLPFEVTKDWVIDKTTGKEFTMDPVNALRLPYTLYVSDDKDHPRHDSINLYFCYSPTDIGKDSTIVNWSTDIPAPYTDQQKSWSYLKGIGIKPGVIWEGDKRYFICDSNVTEPSNTQRINLFSVATAKTRVDKVCFSGADAAEFSVTDNRLHQSPLEGFDMNPGDTIWVEVKFTPDLNKPYPIKYADRQAQLEASFFTDAAHTQRDTVSIDVIGSFNQSLSVSETPTNHSTLTAYTYGHQLIVQLFDANTNYSNCSLYDLLGRKVAEWPKEHMTMLENNMLLPLPKLSSGAYFLRLYSESGHQVSTLVMLQN